MTHWFISFLQFVRPYDLSSDIKPDNLFLQYRPEHDDIVVRIGDFGLTHARKANDTMTYGYAPLLSSYDCILSFHRSL